MYVCKNENCRFTLAFPKRAETSGIKKKKKNYLIMMILMMIINDALRNKKKKKRSSDGRSDDFRGASRVEFLFHGFQFFDVGHGGLALVHDQVAVKVKHEEHEYDEHRYDDYRGGHGGPDRVVPELDPAQDGHLDQEQEQPEHGGERPGQLDETAHALVRRLLYQLGALQLADGVHVGQQVRADHQREYVHGHQHGGAHGEHDEQPFRHHCRLVDLQLHHGHLRDTRVVVSNLFLRLFSARSKRSAESTFYGLKQNRRTSSRFVRTRCRNVADSV